MVSRHSVHSGAATPIDVEANRDWNSEVTPSPGPGRVYRNFQKNRYPIIFVFVIVVLVLLRLHSLVAEKEVSRTPVRVPKEIRRVASHLDKLREFETSLSPAVILPVTQLSPDGKGKPVSKQLLVDPFLLLAPQKPDSVVTSTIHKNGFFAPCETSIFQSVLADRTRRLKARGGKGMAENCLVIDVGSNVGYFSVLAALLNPECYVISVEVSPLLWPYLNATMHLNGIESRVSVIRRAAGSVSDSRVLVSNITEKDPALVRTKSIKNPGLGTQTSVPVLTLDDIIEKALGEKFEKSGVKSRNHYIKLLKIDVEGYEDEVLKGLTKWLDPSDRSHHPLVEQIVVEMKPHRNTTYKREFVHHMLARMGYSGVTYQEQYASPNRRARVLGGCRVEALDLRHIRENADSFWPKYEDLWFSHPNAAVSAGKLTPANISQER